MKDWVNICLQSTAAAGEQTQRLPLQTGVRKHDWHHGAKLWEGDFWEENQALRVQLVLDGICIFWYMYIIPHADTSLFGSAALGDKWSNNWDVPEQFLCTAMSMNAKN